MDSNSRVVHINLHKEGDWPPYDSEEVSATQLSDHEFQISVAPAFARRLAVGDIVRVGRYGPTQVPWVEEVLRPSRHSTLRVIIFAATGKSTEEELSQGIAGLGCTISPGPLDGLFVVDVPGDVNYLHVKEFLESGDADGKWEYEEASISANHASSFESRP